MKSAPKGAPPTVMPGRFFPLGATWDGHGTNFALFSENADAVELCLFDGAGNETRLALRERTAHVFHGYVPGIAPGQRYGFRVHGPYAPERGHRMNPHKLLVDPYAKAIDGYVDYREAVFGYSRQGRDSGVPSHEDSARGVPKGVVIDGKFDWQGDVPPDVAWSDTVLYEAHVKGMTAANPEVPAKLRGTYLGLAHESVLRYLSELGVTTIELMPIHESVNEAELEERGMVNYWGYSTLGFFAPSQRFASKKGRELEELKEMVRRFHAAGIEVVLDVVYNHTGEGGHLGPTLSFRGIDNASYYRLLPGRLAEYEDFTGCGNSLNVAHPQTLKLIMDSLRYWVTEVHIDGFRFDLATTLARETGSVTKLAGFFDVIHQDPVLSRVKLIAEPWDLGDGGYQVGNFPVLWTEWNGRYRDAVRRFWIGDAARVGEMGYRLTGSSDLYEDDGRHPHASINFVTAHDGFTLRDLVSYAHKHNEANGESNRDGTSDNASDNCGVEGETDDPTVLTLRDRRARSLMLTLVLSQGVPMIVAGDELSKTQQGNNNAYVQDNQLSWLDWSPATHATDPRAPFYAFVKALLAFRRRHPVFTRPNFLRGTTVDGSRGKDIAWFRSDGEEMSALDWQSPKAAVLSLLLAGDALGFRDALGKQVVDDTFLLVLNASPDTLRFRVPPAFWGTEWRVEIDTALADPFSVQAIYFAGDELAVAPSSAVVLRRIAPERGSWSAIPPRVKPV